MEAHHSEIQILNGVLPLLLAHLVFLELSFFFFFSLSYPQVLLNSSVPNPPVPPKGSLVDSYLRNVRMIFKHWPALLCFRSGFHARLWLSWLELLHKPTIPLFPLSVVSVWMYLQMTKNSCETNQELLVNLFMHLCVQEVVRIHYFSTGGEEEPKEATSNCFLSHLHVSS